MNELKSLVTRAQAGDRDAFCEIVSRFQDMAYGYAYSLLGDLHLAEDAAQEAFFAAYTGLSTVRNPAAFPGWFRRIVARQCHRITRRGILPTAPLAATDRLPSTDRDPARVAEEHEMKDQVLAAIEALDEPQRTATTLFYINGYSQKDIAEFLEIPVTTVNNRLHASRSQLKERMLTMVEQTIKSNALPEDFRFTFEAPSRTHTTSPSLVFFQDRWVMIWQDGKPSEPHDGPFWFLLSTSSDGRTWSEPQRLPIDPQWRCAPQLCVAGDELLLHTHSHHRGVSVARTSDLTNWRAGPVLPLGDIGRSGICATGADVFLVYPRWCSVKRIGDSVDVLRTSDGSSWTWLTSPQPPRGTGITDAACIARDGRIYILWRGHENRDGATNDVHVDWSDDAGATWCEPVKIEALSTTEGSFMIAPSFGPNGSFVVAQDECREDGTGRRIMLAVSHDGGKTWSQHAEYTAGGLVDPAVAFTPDGTLVLAASSRTKDGARSWVIHTRIGAR